MGSTLCCTIESPLVVDEDVQESSLKSRIKREIRNSRHAILGLAKRTPRTYNEAEVASDVRGGHTLSHPSCDLRHLVERCNRCEPAAQDEFYARYYGMVSVAARKLWKRNPADVDDIVQEIFLQLFKALHSYDPTRPLEPYILTITRRVVVSGIREETTEKRGGKNPTVPLPDEGDPPGLDPALRAEQPLEMMIKAQESRVLRKALDKLPENCRKVIHLRYYEGLSYSEMSSVLGQGEATLRSQAKRCLSSLGTIYSKLSRQKEGMS